MPTITRSANELLRLMIDRMDRRRRMEDPPLDIPGYDSSEHVFARDTEPTGSAAAARAMLSSHDTGQELPDIHELLKAYIRHELSETEREMVAAHLSICPECEAHMETLRGLTGERIVLPSIHSESDTPEEPLAATAVVIAPFRPSRRRMLAVTASLALIGSVAFCIYLFAGRAATREEAKRQAEYDAALRLATGSGKKMEQKLEEMHREAEEARKQYQTAQSTLNQMSVVLANMQHSGGQSAPEPPARPIVLPPISHGSTASPVLVPPKVMLFDGGGVITVDHKGDAKGLPMLPPNLRNNLQDLLSHDRLPRVQLAAGLGERPRADGISPTSPSGTQIEWTQPTLKWTAISGALDYHVTVSDAKGELVCAGNTPANEWTVPNKLTRGRVYAWEVSAVNPGAGTGSAARPLKGSAKFGVLEQAQIDELHRIRKAFSDYNLIVGMQCIRLGLLEEAQHEFQALLESNHGSVIAKKLLEFSEARRIPTS